jgi:uncharacterized protein (DUF1778 family)
MTIEIGTEADMVLVDAMIALLDQRPDPIAQQKAIEILMARHARRASDFPDERQFVLKSMVRHATQILIQSKV